MRMAMMLLMILGFAGCGESGSRQTSVGEAVYNRSCISCHGAGVAGAPIPGDAAAWNARLARGREALIRSVREGIPPGMPPRGMCASCTDEDLAAAVDFMLEKLEPDA